MDIIQPLDLEAGYRTFSFNNKHHLAVTLKLYFPLLGGDPLLFCDAYQEMSKLDTPFIDEGLPKIEAEFFTVGDAISPQGKPVSALTVSTECAGVKKELHVVGDRYWMGGVTGTSVAVPFTKMALNWCNAFGGKSHPLNSMGKGIEKEKTDIGDDLILMPNVEYTHKLMTNKGQTPPPASYLPRPIDHPERSQYLGTYDNDWLVNCFPGYPKDFNFKAFNCASNDQILSTPLLGGETYELKNFHSDHPTLTGSIPQFNARAFMVKPGIEVKDLQESDLKEVNTHIDTVTFFPNQLLGMVIYRGTVEVSQSDGSDYKHLLCGYESTGITAKSKNHYFRSLVGRLHPDLNMQYALTTKDLIPESIPCSMARLTQEESSTKFILSDHIQNKLEETLSGKLADTQQQLTALMEQQSSQGLDTSTIKQQLLNIENPTKGEWQIKFDAVIEKLTPGSSPDNEIDLQKIDFSAFDELEKLGDEYAVFQKNEAHKQLQQQVKSAIASDNKELAANLDSALTKFKLPPVLPRASDPQKKLHELKMTLGQQGELVDFIDIESKLLQGYASQIESYKMGAHIMDAGTPPLAALSTELKIKTLYSIKNSESLEHTDLAGIDFSGEDLRGADFSGCYLEQCDFSYSNLEGVNLKGAILARCNFSHANLKSATLIDSNIGACNFNYCDLSLADTKGAEYGGADFSHATLTNLDLTNNVNTLGVCFHRSNLSGVIFGDASFIETDFSGSNLTKSQFVSATFQKCNFSSCHGTEVQLQGSNFIEANFSQCKFIKSDLTNCRFLDNATLKHSHFVDCILSNSTLREITLEHSNFINCTLNGCDFGGSSAKYSVFDGCSTLKGLFINTDFSYANLSNTNFMYSSFLQAILSKANLSRSNFYGCEFMGATVSKTNFSHSNLDGTKLEDWRPGQWQ